MLEKSGYLNAGPAHSVKSCLLPLLLTKMANTDALLARSLNTTAAVTLSVDKNTSEIPTDLIPHSKPVPSVEKGQYFAQIDTGHALLLPVKDGAVLVVIRCRLQLVSTQMERSWLAV